MTLQELFDELSSAQKKHPNLHKFQVAFGIDGGEDGCFQVPLKGFGLNVIGEDVSQLIFLMPSIKEIVAKAYSISTGLILDNINQMVKDKLGIEEDKMDDEDEEV